MKRIRGRYDGSTVVLREKVDLPPDTEVEVLIPEPQERSLAAILAEPPAVGQVLSLEEVTELIHEVRARRQ
jgi:hypothetical protein